MLAPAMTSLGWMAQETSTSTLSLTLMSSSTTMQSDWTSGSRRLGSSTWWWGQTGKPAYKATIDCISKYMLTLESNLNPVPVGFDLVFARSCVTISWPHVAAVSTFSTLARSTAGWSHWCRGLSIGCPVGIWTPNTT